MLFDTPGWTIKGGLATEGKPQKKRKRLATVDGDPPKAKAAPVSIKENDKGKGKALVDADKQKRKKKRKQQQPVGVGVNGHVEPPALVESSSSAPAPTAFQSSLLSSLSGSRFRLLNETLYTSPGASALDLMSSDPSSFDAYHDGFRKQTEKWPVNPVDVIVQRIRADNSGTVVADLGCGEAGLAKALMTGKTNQGKEFRVLSYDLRSDDEGWITTAQCSSHVPLPGSHKHERAQLVDEVVCCLSLMGTDWVGMILEARRILRLGGRLRIAEVTSRFPSIPAFVSFLSSQLGFRSLGEVDRKTSTHFVLFEFTKAPWEKGSDLAEEQARRGLIAKGEELLKPCIYKRR